MSGIGPAISSADGGLQSTGRPKLTLYLDIVSPFAYIAYWVTRNSAVFKECDVTYVPIFLGGVMKACGNTPPLNIKNKDKWIAKERLRWANYFNMPISERMPDPFPQPTINTGRALCAISAHYPDKLIAAFDALYQAFWVEGQIINNPDVISAALTGHPEFSKDEVEKVMGSIGAAEVKEMLNANTDQAFKDGAFGLPWFVAEKASGEREGFWGVDHLGQVVDSLGLKRTGEPGFRVML